MEAAACWRADQLVDGLLYLNMVLFFIMAIDDEIL